MTAPKYIARDEEFVVIRGQTKTVAEMKELLEEEARRRRTTPQTVFLASLLWLIERKEFGVLGSEFVALRNKASDSVRSQMARRVIPFSTTREYLSNKGWLKCVKIPDMKARYYISDEGVRFMRRVFQYSGIKPPETGKPRSTASASKGRNLDAGLVRISDISLEGDLVSGEAPSSPDEGHTEVDDKEVPMNDG